MNNCRPLILYKSKKEIIRLRDTAGQFTLAIKLPTEKYKPKPKKKGKK